MNTREQLEAAIDAHPDQADNYLVLGDLLQQQGDPRGELIALHRAKPEDSKARIMALQRELGPEPPRYGSWTWFYGFVQRYQNIVDADEAKPVRALLEHPSLRHLTALNLDLGGSEYDERQWLIDAIAQRPRPSWRALTINSYLRGGNDPPSGELDASSLWAVLPRIQTVCLTARYLTPGELRSETLERLVLDGQVVGSELAPVFAGSAPRLKELELHDTDADQLAAAIEAGTQLPALTKLVVSYATPSVQQRILARIPVATFLEREAGDRYEQTGE